MATQYDAKPFVINLNDLAFLLQQVNFTPLFNAGGDAIVDWNGTTPVYDSKGQLIDLTGLDQNAAWAAYGHGFPSVSSFVGIRDVSGLHNNLFGTQQFWGAVDVPFLRSVMADYGNYVDAQANGFYATTNGGFATDVSPFTPGDQNLTTVGTDYTTSVSGGVVTQGDVVDYTPRMITRTIVTGGVNLLQDANGHFVEWHKAIYETGEALIWDGLGNYQDWLNSLTASNRAARVYFDLVTSSNVDVSQDLAGNYLTLVEGAKIVSPIALTYSDNAPLVWDQQDYIDSNVMAVYSQLSVGGTLYGTNAGGALFEGSPLYMKLANGSYVQVMAPTAYSAHLEEYASVVTASGADISALVEGEPILESGYGLLETLGQIDYQNPSSGEFFIGSENPGVSPVNSWFGIFGQFFDHGLDLIGKGGQGTTISIALAQDDPLFGIIGPDGMPATSITISRATVDPTQDGTAQYVNHTSPFIDQSQTYGSVDQITQLLREWVPNDVGPAGYHAGMGLFDGQSLTQTWTRTLPGQTAQEVNNTLPTLSELRDHVLDTDRVALTWEDVGNYRNRSADATTLSGGDSGHALILDMNMRFDSAHLDSTQAIGDTGDTVDSLVDAAIATLDDSLSVGMTFQRSGTGGIELIVTGGSGGPHVPDGTYTGASALIMAGWLNPASFGIMAPPPPVVGAPDLHDAVGQLLMAAVGDHYIAGDGRVNENFGLTSIHHVFHEEHNFQVENLKTWIYAHDTNNPGDLDAHAQLHAWQIDTGTQDLDGNYTYGVGGAIAWDDDKMFDATKLIVEMEYQHAAVDQYARTITPRIQEFVGYSSGVDPTISLEYSQVAFRFGHSTIRETIDAIDPSGWFKGEVTRYALEAAFLNPQSFADEGPGAITLGLSRQQMNEVDEFITPALNHGLLGLPLDLAAINIARGRDLGIPTLNAMREGLGLQTYTSWAEFGSGMVHPESLVNFIAAYSFDGDVGRATAILGLADGTLTGPAFGYTAADAIAFLNNSTSNPQAGADGYDKIDAWIGGLAEAHVPGGLLGETFDAVFVGQIQSLMDGDRFYYLYRLFGTQIHEEVNNGQFKDIVERNTGLEHLNGSIFAYADQYYDFTSIAVADAQTEHAYGNVTGTSLVDTIVAGGGGLGIYSDGAGTVGEMAQNGTIITNASGTYVLDLRPELDASQVHPLEGTPTSGADSHEVIVATDNDDYINARGGDDTVYLEGGNDYVLGGGGIDRLYGGDGDDTLDAGEGPDLVDGGAGKDLIYGRGSGSEVGGFDQLVGGSGNDTIFGNEGIDKLSGGSGDDVIYGDSLTLTPFGNTDPFTHAGDGNDYVDGGASGDLLYGEEGDDLVVGGADQDIVQGDEGDDILRPGNPSQAINGGPDEVLGDDGYINSGFDLIDFSDYTLAAIGVTANLTTQTNPLIAIDGTTPFPAWFQVEGIIGSQNGDDLTGDSTGDATAEVSLGNNWLIGGTGSDLLTGAGGNDLLVGGSIRLDALIGKYTAGAAGYDDNTENAYTGASNRATGALDGTGILDAVGFDQHFVEMLRTQMFKDIVLGDNGDDDLNVDKAVFSGDIAGYQLSRSIIGGHTVVQVSGADGDDVLIGVEQAEFNGGVVVDLTLPDRPFNFTASETASSATLTSNRIFDFGYLSQAPHDGLVPLVDTTFEWSNIGAGTYIVPSPTTGSLTVSTATTGTLIEQRATYPDAFVPAADDVVTRTWNLVVGTTSNNGSLQGVNGYSNAMFGLDGADSMRGGALGDQMRGGLGNDTLRGFGGNDTIDAGAGVDYVDGGDDNDLIIGGPGADIDTLRGGAGNDTIDGGDGADRVYGDAGADHLLAGDGNDFLYIDQNDVSAGLIDGGAGLGDAAFLDVAGSIVGLNLHASNLEAFYGWSPGTFADAVTGNAASTVALTIRGFGGDDNLTGGGGSDNIQGGDGNDTLVGSGGADVLRGEVGADLLIIDQADVSSGLLNGGDGIDTAMAATGGAITGLNLHDRLLEVFVGGTGNDSVVGSAANTVALNLAGNGGVDTLTGGGGNDTIDGGADSDYLQGSGGNDLMSGGTGTVRDTMLGGAGADSLSGGGGSDLLTGNAGADHLSGEDGDDFLYIDQEDVTSGVVSGGAGMDVAEVSTGSVAGLNLHNASVETFRGAGGSDQVTGNNASTAALFISGNGGGDILTAGGGVDFIWGGAGGDVITGGSGADRLRGEADSDTFVFGDGFGQDIVYDSGAGETLDFSGLTIGFDDLADLLAHTTDSGSSVVIHAKLANGSNSAVDTVTMVGVANVADLNGWVINF